MGAKASTESTTTLCLEEAPRGTDHEWLRNFEVADSESMRRLAQDVVARLQPIFKKSAKGKSKKNRPPMPRELHPAVYRIVTEPSRLTVDLTNEELNGSRVVVAVVTLANEASSKDKTSAFVAHRGFESKIDVKADPKSVAFCVLFVERYFPMSRAESVALEDFARTRIRFEPL